MGMQRGSRTDGTEKVDAWVGKLPHAVGRDSGTETSNTQVGG